MGQEESLDTACSSSEAELFVHILSGKGILDLTGHFADMDIEAE